MAPQSGTRPVIWMVLKVAGAMMLIDMTVGIAFEEVRRRQDRKRLPQSGRSVDIVGRSFNLYCSGEGSPVVILEAAAGRRGSSWTHIQPEIARFTPACWYDRAGEGWSDRGPFPRTSAAIAKGLHQLLHRARASALRAGRPLDRRLSTRGRQIIVEQSGHEILEEAPQTVVEAVSEVVTIIRENRGPRRDDPI